MCCCRSAEATNELTEELKQVLQRAAGASCLNQTSGFNEVIDDMRFYFDSDEQLVFERDGNVVVIGSHPSSFMADAAAALGGGALGGEEELQCVVPVLTETQVIKAKRLIESALATHKAAEHKHVRASDTHEPRPSSSDAAPVACTSAERNHDNRRRPGVQPRRVFEHSGCYL